MAAMKPEILYADNHLLVAVKPYNIPSQADSSRDEDMLSLMKAWVKQEYNKPGEVYLGLVQRLDRPTGGVMVFARTSKAAARLTAQIKDGRVKKNYYAVCCGRPKEGLHEAWLLRREAQNISEQVPEGTPGAKKAALIAHVEAEAEGLSLVRVELLTGRHHQIRVQMAACGAPLFGDQRYNAAARPGEQLALWCSRLEVEHPTTHERLEFVKEPRGGIFKKFF